MAETLGRALAVLARRRRRRIQREEQQRQHFGGWYSDHAARVRRWI